MQVRDRLRPDASPREALSHALLSALVDARDRLQPGDGALFHAARERWPEDLDLAWASAVRCRASGGCDPHAALRHLARIDGDNAYTWLQHMHQAADDSDDAAFASALRRAAAAHYLDTRSGSIFLAVRPVLGDAPPEACMDAAALAALEPSAGRTPTADDFADIEAMGMQFAESMPAYSALSGCRPPLQGHVSRRDCIALLGKVAAGDALIDQALALRTLIELQPEQPAGSGARERYRRHLWLWERSHVRPLPAGFIARQFNEGEVAAWQAHLAAEGQWPPPDDWLPENPRQRALVTGRAVTTGP